MAERIGNVHQKSGDLAFTLSTWFYLLGRAGHVPADGAVGEAVSGLLQLAPDADAAPAGAALVLAVKAAIGESEDPGTVERLLVRLFGPERFEEAPAGDREERLHTLRAYHFRSSSPWLARVVSRFDDGSVGFHWLLVEHMAEEVIVMDPYPWDDVEEQLSIPSLDFLVRWELGGQVAFRWRA